MLFSPGTVIANDLPPPEAVAPKPEPTPAADPAKTQVQGEPQQPATPAPAIDAKGLLEAINADRELREKAARDATERETYKKRAEEAESKLNAIEKAKKNRLLDPAGFLKKMGYTDRDLALTSEGIMYSLMPDKAPPGWVANLVAAQREQDQADAEEREKQRESEGQKKAADAKAAHEKELETRYQSSLEREVATFKPGTFKASQAWFADDHKAYAQELFDTANKLAEEALKAGQVIDVSGAAIAAHVEKKYADRAARLVAAFSPAQSPTTTQPPKPPVAPSQPEEKNDSTVIARAGSSRSGMTEREIIERATKAAFGRL